MGIIGRPKHLGVHEHCVKVGSCFVKIHERRRASWPGALQNMVGLTGSQAHCHQRFTTCRLTCLPKRLALAGSYPKVPEVRSNWLTKGGALVESVSARSKTGAVGVICCLWSIVSVPFRLNVTLPRAVFIK